MFRRTPSDRQSDMFTSYESHLGRSKREKLADPKAWHNLFHKHIVSQVDEARFADLFDATQGRPNAPVRILLGMIFLKEGYQWSDEELFEQCGYNLLVMRALGLVNLDEQVPAPSTYYLFKQQVFAYDIANGVDLVGQVYDELTQDQAHHFGVRADYIRMDSKLFGSNIANCCRLQLIVGCLRAFWKALEPDQRQRAVASDRRILDALLEKKPHQVVYSLKETEKAGKLQQLGLVLDRMEESRETPAMDERGKRYFHLLLRSWILTKRFQAMGGVAEGLGDFILGVTVSRLLANPTDGVVQGQDMAPIFADWTRFVAIDMVQHVLRAGRPALLDLFLHAPSKQ